MVSDAGMASFPGVAPGYLLVPFGVIAAHQEKIEAELSQVTPDSGYITKWQREIDIARKNVRKLSEQLEK